MSHLSLVKLPKNWSVLSQKEYDEAQKLKMKYSYKYHVSSSWDEKLWLDYVFASNEQEAELKARDVFGIPDDEYVEVKRIPDVDYVAMRIGNGVRSNTGFNREEIRQRVVTTPR